MARRVKYDSYKIRGIAQKCVEDPLCHGVALNLGNLGCFWHNDDPGIVYRRYRINDKKRQLAESRRGKTHKQWLREQGRL